VVETIFCCLPSAWVTTDASKDRVGWRLYTRDAEYDTIIHRHQRLCILGLHHDRRYQQLSDNDGRDSTALYKCCCCYYYYYYLPTSKKSRA